MNESSHGNMCPENSDEQLALPRETAHGKDRRKSEKRQRRAVLRTVRGTHQGSNTYARKGDSSTGEETVLKSREDQHKDGKPALDWAPMKWGIT